MNNIQGILLFPMRDAEARKQFLIACLVMLAAFIIPVLPTFLLMGYTAKVMRQMIDERKNPSMPAWQDIDWSETFVDGVKLYGAQFVLMLPLLLLVVCGMASIFGGLMSMFLLAEEGTRPLGSIGMILLFAGAMLFVLFSLLSLPYSIILSAVAPHVAAKRSFSAGFDFKEWWQVFQKALGQFLLAYALSFVISFAFVLVMQIALMTLILICIVPFVMIPYSAYLMLVTNALYAQAYSAGRDALQAESAA